MSAKSLVVIIHPLLVVLVLVVILIRMPDLAQAASPSPTASPKTNPVTSPKVTPTPTLVPSSSPSAETTEKLKARIEKIVEEKKSQIMGAITDLQQVRRGFIGEIQRVTAETITLKTVKGTQILVLNKDVGVTKAGTAVTVDKIAVGDWAMVIGHSEDDTFMPDLIDISSESLRPKTHLIALGTLTELTKTTVTFQAKSQTETQKLNIVAKTTKFEDSDGNELTFKEIKKDTAVLLIGQQNDTNWEVELIRVLKPIE